MDIFVIDIDGTLFNSKYPDYQIKSVRLDVIEAVNREYDKGNYIKLFTARGSGTGRDLSDLTFN